ncbi:hypothetical protein BD410DRAFT_880000 [Rickenella mellea]|uniref:Uncharacterized protein n=1 Tax=Rickenella mellea TaxID=50990 RepID=A0A4Y7PT15_9AGAM|nr:hypothetical protein BD410DRAFT_880000 [Rickenella mellea]
MSQVERNAQDDELFARAWLVNCGFFMQVILGDYVGAILGWRWFSWSNAQSHTKHGRAKPAAHSPSYSNSTSSTAGTPRSPNTTLNGRKMLFRKLLPDVSLDKVTVEMFVRGARWLLAGGEMGVREWTFDGPNGAPLKRSTTTGRFADADLAAILQNATAGAFRARGIPAVLKVVEVMGIDQSRNWGACSLDGLRSPWVLSVHGSFKELNPDPEIHMQAEQTKPAIPGSGLYPGFTKSRTILADAVALTRGDPFLTTLSTWGHADCYPDMNDDSCSDMLTHLLSSPVHYPSRSTYPHFPLLVPADIREFMQDVVVVVKSAKGMRDVLMKSGNEFGSGSSERVKAVVRVSKVDIAIVNNVLNAPNELKRYGPLFTKMTNDLIRGEVPERQPGLFLDVIRDANLVAAGIPLKTVATPHGQYTDRELLEKLADVSMPEHADRTLNYLSIGGLTDNVMHRVSGENTRSHAFLSFVITSFKIQSRGKKVSLDEQAYSVFISAAGTAAIHGAMMAQIVDFFLHSAGNGAEIGENLAAVCREEVNEMSNRDLVAFAREA